MMNKNFLLLKFSLFYICVIYTCTAQDIQFGQIYTNTIYLNPGLAGITPYSRFMAHHRTQWREIDAKYSTTMASFDKFLPSIKSGFAVSLLHDKQGKDVINTNEINAQYSYEIDVTPNLIIRPGIQGSYTNRTIDNSTLIFPDQYNNNGYAGASATQLANQRINYADISAGLVVFDHNFWMGYSAHHLNRPNQTFIGKESLLPVKHGIIAGYKFQRNVKENGSMAAHKNTNWSFTPTIYYKFQGKSDQLDLGIYIVRSHSLILGAWYRGLPFIKKYKNNQNNESIIPLIGWRFHQVQLTYSYDFIVSRLAPAGPAGSHEFNIAFYVKTTKKKKPMKYLPCPDLYDE